MRQSPSSWLSERRSAVICLSGSLSSSEYLVVGEEREAFSESMDVHDGFGACHLG